MNCRDRQHQVVLFLYNELTESAQKDLGTHMEGCTECRSFLERERELYNRLGESFSDWEVPSDLLVECRRDLSEELDRIETRRAWWRLPQVASIPFRVRLLESAALVALGLALGVYVTNERTVEPDPSVQPNPIVSLIPPDAEVSNLRIVNTDAATGQVALAAEMVQPMVVTGGMNDAQVRDLLFGTLRSAPNPGTRLQVAEFLARNPRDPSVKEVLMGALLNDPNAGVRFEALEGLKALANEEDVRRALIFTLENDDAPGMRMHAIEALTPLTQEEAMEEVVQEAIRENPNVFIQTRSLQFVGSGGQ